MSEHEREHLIPPLRGDDFFEAGLEVTLDGDIKDQIHELRRHDPELASSLILAAHSGSTLNENTPEFRALLHSHLGLVRAIERALRRQRDERSSSDTSVDDDEDSPL
jgi:hypothetical protein